MADYPPGTADVKKKVITGELTTDPSSNALLVHYQVETTFVDARGRPIQVQTKDDVKRLRLTLGSVRLKPLTSTVDVSALAKQIVNKTKLIHASSALRVEKLLYELQARGMDETAQPEPKKSVPQLDDKKPGSAPRLAPSLSMVGPKAHMYDLDSYIDDLYDDISGQVEATRMLVLLARLPENLEELANEERLFAALSRILREEGRKNIDLLANITHFFFFFSQFSQFHYLIAEHRVGSLCIHSIENEIQRRRLWDREKKKVAADPVAKKKLAAQFKHQEKLRAKQERLLSVSFHLLLNLAEDVNVERKMKKKRISSDIPAAYSPVSLLVAILVWEWKEPAILVVVLTFLKKLSIFAENKNEMVDRGIIKRLRSKINHPHEGVMNALLRLVLNLSFDLYLQRDMRDAGYIPLLSKALMSASADNKELILRVMYHLSMDKAAKPMFGESDVIPHLLKMVVEWPTREVGTELIALCINLSTDPNNCAIIVEKNGIPFLLRRIGKTADPMLMKFLRNISFHPGDSKTAFLEHIPTLIEMAKGNDDIAVEAMGTLANLVVPEINWPALVEDYDVISWIATLLRPGAVPRNLLVEVIVLLRAITDDPKCLRLVIAAGLLEPLSTLMRMRVQSTARKVDVPDSPLPDEGLIECLKILLSMTTSSKGRKILCQEHTLLSFVANLLYEDEPKLRYLADAFLDEIMFSNKEVAAAIRQKKFALYNEQWLAQVKHG